MSHSNQLLNLRLAIPQDCDEIFYWRNEIDTRKMSLCMQEISYDDHVIWYSKALLDPLQAIYIGEVGQKKIGVCRLKYDNLTKISHVSIIINPIFRGKGYSHLLLGECIFLYRLKYLCPIRAIVKIINSASKRLFIKCGFKLIEIDNNLIVYQLD
jgi:RimJ/RimL family protein N-acetyltransferase